MGVKVGCENMDVRVGSDMRIWMSELGVRIFVLYHLGEYTRLSDTLRENRV